MPNFTRAEISTTAEDLTEYKSFLRRLEVGHVVRLPLERGETTRRVMRSLNTAAEASGMRLTRLPSDGSAVRFKVATPEKRRVNLSVEARQARAEKARATRAARGSVPGTSSNGIHRRSRRARAS
jgi:hypothetical protein